MIDLMIHNYQPMIQVINKFVRIIISRTNTASSLVISIRIRIMNIVHTVVHTKVESYPGNRTDPSMDLPYFIHIKAL